MNLLLVDPSGTVVAVSRPDKFPQSLGANVSARKWFTQSMHTTSGDQYVVDDIYLDSTHQNLPVSVYATAVRRGGKMDGKITGVLGVFFDWAEQSRVIVRDEANLSAEEWKRSTVLLLDNKLRIIASSDGKNLLQPFSLEAQQKTKGTYVLKDGTIIAFARTIGYQEYDGLGWYGVIVQKPAGN